ncbi:hypothetical protein JAAARDRAFT_33945 [Jaapia argillacea MUCL 33604]|uniref:Zinc finger PHD-type domain-containing protein n=1 Tax=Jaapia argillacea MUCL 33604 TaxID=933084 RepID=A0A067PWW3_9AGAM|nr:hypothetical protein JAAARDRAFT_33945 [Jaapia argillacea MUCL 33604]
MPRRSSTRTTTRASSFQSPAPHALPSSPPPPTTSSLSNQALLRRQWKWAAFSQFFYTFNRLLAMEDVTLLDVEDDLTRSTTLVLPRIMYRLLYTLTLDKKLTLENWQTSLRKQYFKRKPEANPLGPEPQVASPSPSPEPPSRLPSQANELDIADPLTPPKAEDVDTVLDAPTTLIVEEDISQEANGSTIDPVEDKVADLSPEESKDWLDLPMVAKLDSLHILAEWQFDNALRLRSLMKMDGEDDWRIEPVGYDSQGNGYWLIGPDRLWLQREPPKPPKSLKRKRGAPTRRGNDSTSHASTSHAREDPPKPSKPPRTKSLRSRASDAASKRGGQTLTGTSGKGKERAAKSQANIKLDAQAKALAAFKRGVVLDGETPSKRQKTRDLTRTPSRPVGTRASARLRGATQEDEWQQIPDEWLADDANNPEDREPVHEEEKPASSSPATKGLGKAAGTGLESDSDSELTDLSDEVDNQLDETKEEPIVQDDTKHEEEADDWAEFDNNPPRKYPADFVEWETICVTLYEWEHVTERFEKPNHYAEKALLKKLTSEIVPAVTTELKEVDRKRRIEEAIVHRKRSSRIAVKESAKEEARIVAQRKAEEEEKLSRARRLEARLKKEEEERERREQAREQRRREREERDQRALAKEEEPPSAQTESDRSVPPQVGRNGTYTNGSSSGLQTPSGEDWELDCEICHRHGINQDEGVPMMCCGSCSKWQHIACHDNADRQAGRLRRNWEAEEFTCRRCRGMGGSGSSYSQAPPHAPQSQLDHMDARKNMALQWQHSRSRIHEQASYGHHPRAESSGVGPVNDYNRLVAPPSAPIYAGTSQHSNGPVASYGSRNQITFAHYEPQRHGFNVVQGGPPQYPQPQPRPPMAVSAGPPGEPGYAPVARHQTSVGYYGNAAAPPIERVGSSSQQPPTQNMGWTSHGQWNGYGGQNGVGYGAQNGGVPYGYGASVDVQQRNGIPGGHGVGRGGQGGTASGQWWPQQNQGGQYNGHQLGYQAVDYPSYHMSPS